jgi:hypothetical protein
VVVLVAEAASARAARGAAPRSLLYVFELAHMNSQPMMAEEIA